MASRELAYLQARSGLANLTNGGRAQAAASASPTQGNNETDGPADPYGFPRGGILL